MKLLLFMLSLTAASFGAPVQHYGYDFHVSTNHELEPLAEATYEQRVAPPNYYKRPASASRIISQQSSGDSSTGRWSWGYQTENGISFAEEGHLEGSYGRNVGDRQPSSVVRGKYSYVGPDGVLYTVTYYADETGFHPSGAHLPASAL